MSSPQVEFIEVDGVNLRVATQSGKGGLPLLLFNGIGANLELCFPFMEAMPEKEIVIFDVPGVGRSEMSWRPRRFSGLARLANKLLDRLGYQKVDVIGVSWGGALAQQFARQYPERCRRLILAATSPGAIMVPGRPSALSKMVTPRRYLSPTYMQKAAGDIYGGEARRDPKLMSAHTARIIPPQFMGYVYQLLAGMGWTSIIGCIAFANLRWSWRGPRIRSYRRSMRGSFPCSSPTTDCSSFPGAATSSCSTP
jgi:poly(3-hydroxyalkanoate) depolymerase